MLVVCLLGALPACAGSPTTASDSQPEGTLRVYPWLDASFDALVAEFNARYPKVEVQGGVVTFDEEEKFAHDVFLAGPVNVADYVGTEADQSARRLLNLDALAARESWHEAFSEDVRRGATLGGSIWAVPLYVSRTNTMMYNEQLLVDVGICASGDTVCLEAPLASLDQLKSTCEAVEDAIGQKCLALGAANSSEMAFWILDGVFPAVAGGAHTRSFLRGELSGDDPLFLQTLETVSELLNHANYDRARLTVDGAAELVISARAAFSPIWDGNAVTPSSIGGVVDVDFRLVPQPGAANIYVFEWSGFVAKSDTKNRPAALAWLEVVGSETAQIIYNQSIGLVPARRMEPAIFSGYQRRGIEAFADPDVERVDALWSVLKRELWDEVATVLGAFVIAGDVASTADWFQNNYERFR